MTLFLYPETQYSHSVVFSAEEKVAQLKEEKAFCFHKKEQTLKSFAFSQLNYFFCFEPEGKDWGGFLGPGYSNAAWFLLLIVPKKNTVD